MRERAKQIDPECPLSCAWTLCSRTAECTTTARTLGMSAPGRFRHELVRLNVHFFTYIHPGPRSCRIGRRLRTRR